VLPLHGILPSGVDGLEDCFKDNRPFAGLETGFQQFKYYKANFNFVVICGSIMCT